ncbi:MAG: hypothetical protein AAGF85_22415 [Bacteroidota bacterium]
MAISFPPAHVVFNTCAGGWWLGIPHSLVSGTTAFPDMSIHNFTGSALVEDY